MGRLGPPRPRARPAPPRGTSQARKPPPHVNGAQTGQHFECMNHEMHAPWEASLRAHLLPYSPHTDPPHISAHRAGIHPFSDVFLAIYA